MTVGEKIRAARTALGLTQDKLGERCGIAGANIRKYELGKANPKYETLQRIADALNIPVTDIMGADWHPRSAVDNFIKTTIYGVGVTVPNAAEQLKERPPVECTQDAEERIGELLTKLNTTGQNVAVERVEELTKIPDYQK